MLDSWYSESLYNPEVHGPTELIKILEHWSIGLQEVAQRIDKGDYRVPKKDQSLPNLLNSS